MLWSGVYEREIESVGEVCQVSVLVSDLFSKDIVGSRVRERVCVCMNGRGSGVSFGIKIGRGCEVSFSGEKMAKIGRGLKGFRSGFLKGFCGGLV